MNSIALWIKAARAPFLTGTIIPVLFGSTLAYCETGQFYWLMFFLALIGSVAAQAAANMANDYFDHRTTDDDVNANYTPFSGGSRMIQDKLVTPRAMLIGAFAAWGIALACGIYLFLHTPGYWVLIFAGLGFLGGFFYTATRYAFAYNRVGELSILACFGILPIMGSYFVQTGNFTWLSFWASFPIGFLITAILYVNEFPDYEADKSVGKNHLVVTLGKKWARLGYYFLIFGNYVGVVLLVLFAGLTPWALVALLSLPVAVKTVRIFTREYLNIKEFIPAQAGTIQVHFLSGLLMSIGCIIGAVV
ncbi:MAG: 1,4-dihydroxy-2-naphthoate octaprenyltransferase [Candidatus Zixiibacteriota bacterium]